MNDSTEPISPAPAAPASIGSRLKKAAGGKFVRDTIILQAGMAVTMATYVVTSVLLARGMGAKDFGRYNTAFALYGIVYFLANIGVTTAAISNYAQAVGRGDEDGKIRSLAAYLKSFVVMGVVIMVVGSLLPWFCVVAYDDRDIGIGAWLLCLLGPLQLLNGFVLVVLQGARRMADYVLYDNACGILRVLLLMDAVLAGLDIIGVIVVYLISGVLASLLGLRMYALTRVNADRHDAPPALRDVIRALPHAQTGSLYSQGTLIAVSKNMGELIRNLTMSAIGFVAGPTATGHFSVAYRYIWALQSLLGGLGKNLLPAMGFRLSKTEHDMGRFAKDLLRIALVAGVFFVVLTAVFVAIAPWLLHLLYGPEYDDAIRMTFYMAIGHLSLGAAVVIDPFYIYTKQLGTLVKLNLSLFFSVVVPMGYVLITRYGAEGGALALSGCQLLLFIHIVVIVRFLRKVRRDGWVRPAGDESKISSRAADTELSP